MKQLKHPFFYLKEIEYYNSDSYKRTILKLISDYLAHIFEARNLSSYYLTTGKEYDYQYLQAILKKMNVLSLSYIICQILELKELFYHILPSSRHELFEKLRKELLFLIGFCMRLSININD